MNILYQIFIQIFSLGYRVASLFSDKAKKGYKGRKLQKEFFKPFNNERYIWVHCSSVGEFEQGRPLIEAIKKQYPNKKIALSFFSPSGYELRKNYDQADVVFYLPIDTKENLKNLFKYFNPEILILIKYEYWFNLLEFLKEKNIPIVVVSAIFRENQYKFKWLEDKIFRFLKNKITHFFVQNKASAQVLKKHGISNFNITGDTRYDRVSQIAHQEINLPWLNNFKGLNHLLVLGSTWQTDENVILNVLKNKLPQDWKVVIVPHEIDDNTKPYFRKELNEEVTFYSEKIKADKRFLVVDAIGFLSQIYAYANMAFVGGGFNKSGVHNTLEPAVFGIPVLIGPNYKKFQEVHDLIQAGVIYPIENESEFQQKLLEIIQQNPDQFKKYSAQVFEKNVGATQKVLRFLEHKNWL